MRGQSLVLSILQLPLKVSDLILPQVQMQDTNGSHEQDGIEDIPNMQEYLGGIESAHKAPAQYTNIPHHI